MIFFCSRGEGECFIFLRRGCIIYFSAKRLLDFFVQRGCRVFFSVRRGCTFFFVQRGSLICAIFVEGRDCMIFFTQRLRDFFWCQEVE